MAWPDRSMYVCMYVCMYAGYTVAFLRISTGPNGSPPVTLHSFFYMLSLPRGGFGVFGPVR
jgi:hypothetical protein